FARRHSPLAWSSVEHTAKADGGGRVKRSSLLLATLRDSGVPARDGAARVPTIVPGACHRGRKWRISKTCRRRQSRSECDEKRVTTLDVPKPIVLPFWQNYASESRMPVIW